MRLRLGLILVLAGGIVAAVAVALWRVPARGHEVIAVLSEAPQLRDGALVTYLGVPVGTVRSMDLSTGRVVLTLGIQRSDVLLRQGDSVRIHTQGLLGDKVVDIVASRGRRPLLAAHDTLFGRDEPGVRVDPRRLFEMLDSASRAGLRIPDSTRPGLMDQRPSRPDA
jgi:ABC-type transporter Mla subunit MlaD